MIQEIENMLKNVVAFAVGRLVLALEHVEIEIKPSFSDTKIRFNIHYKDAIKPIY